MEHQAIANLRDLAAAQAAEHPSDPAIAYLAGYIAGRLEAPLPTSEKWAREQTAGVA